MLMKANELGEQLLDVANPNANAAIDHQLISAVGYQQGVATSRFEQLADELVGVRSRLTRYLGDLHGVNQTWGVSAYQTIQNLASISELPAHPMTRVRLTKECALAIGKSLDEWAKKLERAGELGEYSVGPDDTAWYGASLYSEEEAIDAYQRVVNVLRSLLPATREQVTTTVKVCGFSIPQTADEWSKQVTVLKNLRRVLDVFQPEIFERDIDAMIEATESKQERKTSDSQMGFWDRRRHIKEAKSMLRVGAQVEDLHEALLVVKRQGEQWRLFVPHGGWPVLPPKLDDIIATQEQLMSNLTALDTVLATTPAGAELQQQDFNALEERLKALFDDRKALDTLPERCVIERELKRAGLGELVDDLRERKVKVDAVSNELRLAWCDHRVRRHRAFLGHHFEPGRLGIAGGLRPLRAGGCGACALHWPHDHAGIDAQAVRPAVLPHAGGQHDAHGPRWCVEHFVEPHPSGPSGDSRCRQTGDHGRAGHARCRDKSDAHCRRRDHRCRGTPAVGAAAQHSVPCTSGGHPRASQHRDQ